MWERIKNALILTALATVVISAYFGYHIMLYNQDKSIINEKISSLNGQVTKIETESNGVGTPFYVRFEGDRIYKITYKTDGVEKVGYAKMNALQHWKLED